MPRAAAPVIVCGLAVLMSVPAVVSAASPPSLPEAALGRQAAPASPIPAPDLEPLDDLVEEQIRERQQWHRRVMDAAGAEPDDRVLAHAELAALYHAYGLFDAAEAGYRNAARLAPDDHRWLYALGLVERDRNQTEAAIATLERALALAPDDVPTLIRLAELRLDQNEPERARPLLERALALEPANAAVLAALGQIALSGRDFAAAARFLERALAAQPGATSLHAPLAMAHRALGDTDRAAAALAQHGTGEVTMDDPLLRKLHGLARAQREHQQRGTEAFEAGRTGEAIAELRQAVREDPLYSLPRVNLALALMRTGELDEAVEELLTALRIAPGNARAHFTLGYTRAQQGAHEEALLRYRAAVGSDPEYVEAWFNLAASLAALGRHADAAGAYAEAVDRRPDWPVARLLEARSLLLAGRDADARDRLEAAAAAMPRDGYLAHALARLLATSPDGGVRDGSRALALAQALFAARPSVEHAETAAMALAELGRFDEAVRWQREALAIADREPGAGDRDLLERRLARYQRGEPSRAPWTDTGELIPFPGASR